MVSIIKWIFIKFWTICSQFSFHACLHAAQVSIRVDIVQFQFAKDWFSFFKRPSVIKDRKTGEKSPKAKKNSIGCLHDINFLKWSKSLVFHYHQHEIIIGLVKKFTPSNKPKENWSLKLPTSYHFTLNRVFLFFFLAFIPHPSTDKLENGSRHVL